MSNLFFLAIFLLSAVLLYFSSFGGSSFKPATFLLHSPTAHLEQAPPCIMEIDYLKGKDFEQLLANDKFVETDSISIVHLLNFKRNRELYVKIPSRVCEKNPYDGFVWSKTKFGKDKKVEYRHQPTYSKIKIHGETVQSMRCTDFNNQGVHKQVISYQDYTYVYMFTSSLNDIIINDAPNKRLDKATKETLMTNILPMRTVTGAVKVARDMGIPVTRKQVANLARSSSEVITGKTGPRSKTTLKMVQDLKILHPDTVWFEHDSSQVLTDFTFIKIFEEGSRIFFKGCPTKERWNDWILLVDNLQTVDEETRKREVKKLLAKTPSGIFFPSRLHVDTTFNLGDVYVTVVLGETNSFKTKSSLKPRVIPIGYMLHSTKAAENHLKFATALAQKFFELDDPNKERHIPCVLLDGESALEQYPEMLSAAAIRCDVHLLSLIRFDYGGKAVALQAKPFLFGKMKDGKWRSGLLGCFDEQTYDKRLRHISAHVDPRVFDWLEKNKKMLFETASAYAKFRAGHILQYSTNNQNETFNGIIKATLSRRHPVPELIRRLDHCCEGKLRECWLSALDGSEYVFFSTVVDGATLQERISAYSSSGLIAVRMLGLNVPLRIAEGFDHKKVNEEELACENIQLLALNNNTFHLEDTSLPDGNRDRYINVKVTDDAMMDCWKCGPTLPAYICSHVIFCLCRLKDEEVDAYWSCASGNQVSTKAVNTFPGRSGLKLSDRIGSKQSARNHVRKMAEISSITFDSDSSISLPDPNQSSSTVDVPFSPNISDTSTPHSSDGRRTSSRVKRPKSNYSPSYNDSSNRDSTI